MVGGTSIPAGYAAFLNPACTPLSTIAHRHVLAATICAGAQTIVTHNLTDFPDHCLNPYGIEATDPATFVVQQMDLHEADVVAVARDHRAALKNPPKTVDEYREPWQPRAY
jgi:hypothetical protein